MRRLLLLPFVFACAGSDEAGPASDSSALAPAEDPSGSEGAGATDDDPFVTFVDPETGFRTADVHDADRELVRFDASLEAMVSQPGGEQVTGWRVTGTDLDWTGSGVAFRVRFGTEEGERRAYFTEAGPGTICDLTFVGGGRLSIFGTRELPPGP